jgi:N-acetylmuramoyl-L-alanine amidase
MTLFLAGCVSPPRQNLDDLADWQDFDNPAPTNGVVAKPTPTNPPATPPKRATPDQVEPGNRSRETWVRLQEWTRSRGLGSPIPLSSGPPASYAVKSTNGVAVLSVGNLIAHWDGLELRLGFAPQLINGEFYVHGLDLRKTLLPLLQGATITRLSPGSVVVIDPGHGGTDVGTRSVLRDHYEKELTLDWALRLQSVMSARGCQVYLTRSSDFDLALSNRVAFATQHNADMFISLHFNSAGENTAECGLETYCLTPAGMPSSITRGFADEAWQTFPNNAFDSQNLRLAFNVHRALLQVNGHRDRGVRRARFPGVLRGQQRPAILIEGGYLSNPHEAGLIAEPAYRQLLAEAIARALLPAGETMTHVSRVQDTQVVRERAQLPAAPPDPPTAEIQTPAGAGNNGASP